MLHNQTQSAITNGRVGLHETELRRPFHVCLPPSQCGFRFCCSAGRRRSMYEMQNRFFILTATGRKSHMHSKQQVNHRQASSGHTILFYALRQRRQQQRPKTFFQSQASLWDRELDQELSQHALWEWPRRTAHGSEQPHQAPHSSTMLPLQTTFLSVQLFRSLKTRL